MRPEPSDITRTEEISRTLVSARRAAKALSGFPGELPATLEEAYEVQDISIAAWPDWVAGWKVGGIPPDRASAVGARFLAGPIFENSVVRGSGAAPARMPVFGGGFAAIEPELILELGGNREADRLYIGVEIASSPLPAINDIGPLAVVCDFGNNNGMLVGPEIPDWRDALSREVMVVATIDGTIVGERTSTRFVDHVDDALDFLFDHAESRGIELPAGRYVSTGAITGVHEAEIGARSELIFGRFGKLEVELVPAVAIR